MITQPTDNPTSTSNIPIPMTICTKPAACSASMRRMRRGARSPISASMPCSTAARRARDRHDCGRDLAVFTGVWAWSRRCSTRKQCSACAARSASRPSAIPATRPPGSNRVCERPAHRGRRPHLGPLALAHNGNIINAPALKRGAAGARCALSRGTTDSEVIAQALAHYARPRLGGAHPAADAAPGRRL